MVIESHNHLICACLSNDTTIYQTNKQQQKGEVATMRQHIVPDEPEVTIQM